MDGQGQNEVPGVLETGTCYPCLRQHTPHCFGPLACATACTALMASAHMFLFCAVAQVDEWAGAVTEFVRTFGLSDSVMTVDELSSGDDVRGTGASLVC